ncbi:N-acetylmuramoyl-L-alanine amidase [Terrilactibacillus laevilacticus]|uniref:N-acetylmuramoyl-L-alanine amidase n=1 Tax=Terrilactibacillus laevilacticus TaxID=1380157 RepID=A0ABW5PNG4_9BACI|nr:N-acetylmuramoyl-L-alanine amidase [Terrilactibacillus laevilacticus]
MALKLYLDPGHGGKDTGASGHGLQEKNLTLQIALRLRDILEREYTGHSIKMSRTTDTYRALSQRTNEANSWGAKFFLSIHINAGGGTGYEDYVYPGTGSPTTTYQNIIHQAVIGTTRFIDRGMKTANYHVLRESYMPALLTENGFIDNDSDANKLKESNFIEKIARGHVNGLVKAFHLSSKKGANKGKASARTSSRRSNDGSFRVRVKVQDLYYYNKPDWNSKVGLVHKGEVFTVVKTLRVNESKMYKLKSGNFLTANPNYVEIL